MITPSPSQIAIRDANDLGMVIVAPAGCGKTEALALRIAGLIERGAVEHPRRILVATFTNRARDNMKERLTSYLSPPTMRDRVTVANFHGLSARIVRAHAAVIGMDPDWALPESDWVTDQCRSRGLSYSESTSVQELLRTIKQQALTDSGVAHRLESASNTSATEIEQLRKSEQQLTYDDLPRIAELILTNDTVAQLYQNHFGVVIVDEFQDLTPQQLRIINKIGHSRTTYAGDLAQGIYGFAGAQPNSVYETICTECAREVVITDSHRSSPAVLAMVSSLAHRTGGTQLSSFDPSSWPLGGLGGRIDFQSTEDEANWVVGFVQKVLDHAPDHRIGVIARTGPRRRFVDAAFAVAYSYRSPEQREKRLEGRVAAVGRRAEIATHRYEIAAYFDDHVDALNRAFNLERQEGASRWLAGLNSAALLPPIGVFQQKDRAYYEELRAIARDFSPESKIARKLSGTEEERASLAQRALLRYLEIAEAYGDEMLPKWLAQVNDTAMRERGQR